MQTAEQGGPPKEAPTASWTAGASPASVEGRVGLVARGLISLVHSLANRAFEHFQQGSPAGAVRDLEAHLGQPEVGTTADEDGVGEVHSALGLNHRSEAHSEGEDLHSVGGSEDDVFHKHRL
jgi:hypothetical protein